jgi:hypothetical protein
MESWGNIRDGERDASTLEELKTQRHSARFRAQSASNKEILQLWWRAGRTIL